MIYRYILRIIDHLIQTQDYEMKCMPISMYMEPNEPHHKERAYMSKVVVTAKLSNMENLNTRDKCYSSHPPSLTTIHVIGISNLIDDKIKKPI